MVKESLDKGVSSLKETSKEWARKVGIDSVEKLNAMIDSGRGMELVLVCEVMQSNSIYEIARRIAAEKRRIILLQQKKTTKKRCYACTISPKASTFYNQRL